MKQRGGLTAATETLSQFDLTTPTLATPLVRWIYSRHSWTAPEPTTCGRNRRRRPKLRWNNGQGRPRPKFITVSCTEP